MFTLYNVLISSTEIGMGLTGFGVFFLLFGMVLFFDKALLAIGNVSYFSKNTWYSISRSGSDELPFFAQILFVSGLSFVIGLERTFRFFFQWHKVKATGFFLGGVLVVLLGWPIVGVILEVYGFFLLFRWAQCWFVLVVDVSFWMNSHLGSSPLLPGEQGLFPSGSGLHQTGSRARLLAQLTWNQFGTHPTIAENNRSKSWAAGKFIRNECSESVFVLFYNKVKWIQIKVIVWHIFLFVFQLVDKVGESNTMV